MKSRYVCLYVPYVVEQWFPTWGTCTPSGTFVHFRGYIGFERITNYPPLFNTWSNLNSNYTDFFKACKLLIKLYNQYFVVMDNHKKIYMWCIKIFHKMYKYSIHWRYHQEESCAIYTNKFHNKIQLYRNFSSIVIFILIFRGTWEFIKLPKGVH